MDTGTAIKRYLELREGPRSVSIWLTRANRNICVSDCVQLSLETIVESRSAMSAALARRVAAALIAAAEELEALTG